MRSLLFTSTVLALTLLSGCTTYVQVSSDPEGALISSAEGSTTYGRAPVSIPFDKDALEASGGRIPGFIATWPSGARAESENPYTVMDFRYGAQIELKRPANAPRLDEDLKFALSRAQERARAAEAERDRMRLYMDNTWFWGPRLAPGFYYWP